jgi:hypothetical protein
MFEPRRLTVLSTSRRAIEITHVVIESTKPAAELQKALEASLPPLDPEVSVLLGSGLTDRLKQRLEALPALSILYKWNHGELTGLYGAHKDAVRYLIGNPLMASTMTCHALAAGMYAPLSVIIYARDDGGSGIEYDLPSSLFGQFGDDRLTEVARGLDVELLRALSAAAG